MVEEIIIETEVIGDTIETDSDSLIGTPGINGVTFTPSVSEEGIISWTNDGGLENPDPINIKGKDGEKGEPGDAFTYDMFTPEQLESLKGEQGDKGDKGDKGEQGEMGIGVPSGGKEGQILTKTSDDDYDTEWKDITSIDVKVPTKVSELENDSNYLSMNDDYSHVTGRLHVSNKFDTYVERPVDISTKYLMGAEDGGLPGTLYINYNVDKDVRILEKGTGTLYYKGNEVADRYYVDEQIANVEIGDIDLSDYAKKEDLNTKTDTTILPNDNGDIKTRFRICNKAEDESPVIYFPLVKLPQDNSKNSASVILKGRIGGFLSKDMAMVNALIWNRTTTGISLFNINADTYTLEEPLRLCDIVVYTNEDTTDTVYLKCREWYVFDIDLEVHQSTAEILYDGTYLTEEPSGTLSASASTSDKRVEVFNGKLYLNGTEISGDIDLSDYASKEYVDEKVANIEVGGVDLSDYATKDYVNEQISNIEISGGSGSDYELPIASSSTLGGIKVGANLTIDENGVLSANASGSSLKVYSTEEKVVGTWVDGKTIYERTLIGTTTSNQTNIDIGSNMYVMQVIGFVDYPPEDCNIPFEYTNPNAPIYYNVTKSTIRLYHSSVFSNHTYYATIIYTKTNE